MKLYHPFSQETRNLFMYKQYCWKCGSNGNGRGGLELHHICGRRKTGNYLDSPFNASVLCKICHEGILHTDTEQLNLFLYTVEVLKDERYIPKEYDIMFLCEHSEYEFGKTVQAIMKLI